MTLIISTIVEDQTGECLYLNELHASEQASKWKEFAIELELKWIEFIGGWPKHLSLVVDMIQRHFQIMTAAFSTPTC